MIQRQKLSLIWRTISGNNVKICFYLITILFFGLFGLLAFLISCIGFLLLGVMVVKKGLVLVDDYLVV